jgi:PTH1 family peptidyl-tRNA hydrolase
LFENAGIYAIADRHCPDHPVVHAKNFVLERFSKTEAEEVEKILELSADAVRTIMTEGVDQAMARFN